MAEIVLKNVKKVYPGGNTAVEDFNLEIGNGEFVVFVGPSGCGKSTTLRMIAGLEECTGGEISIDGQLMNGVEPKNRDVAMVFQSYALYRTMTVYDNMAFTLKMIKVPKKDIDKRVRMVAELLKIDHLLKRKPGALSGGECQRVALGRALVRKRKVYLFDEPLSNLDAKLRSSMRAELIRIHEELDATFVYVTHDQTEAMTMGDRIVVMNKGHIMQCDTPQHIYSHPDNIFTAGFIGTPQMNFLGATFVPGCENKKLIAGVRPENVLTDGSGLVIGQGRVEMVEQLGSGVNIHFSMEGKTVVASAGADTRLQRGDSCTLSAGRDKVILFDADSGDRVTEPGGTADEAVETV